MKFWKKKNSRLDKGTKQRNIVLEGAYNEACQNAGIAGVGSERFGGVFISANVAATSKVT